jgi:Domain of unknown function (DUF5017)
MKRYTTLCSVLVAALFFSCKEEALIAPNNFNVTTTATTFNVGDNVTFTISDDDANQIVFYSGETGRKYENATRTVGAGTPKLFFQTTMQQGAVPPAATTDTLRLLISSNLTGYDAASIQKATWTDITKRNTKWPTSLATSYTNSDTLNLSDFNSADSINIAFKVENKANATLPQRKWGMQGFSLVNVLADGTSTVLFAAPQTAPNVAVNNFTYVGWVQASIANNTLSGFNAWNVGTWNISTADSIRNSNGISIRTAYPITFDPGTNLNNPDNEDWLMTSKVNLKQVVPDFGTTIKNRAGQKLLTYSYKFLKAGTFNVTFVAQNGVIADDKRVTKQIQLTIK